jgi:hypothetical protein
MAKTAVPSPGPLDYFPKLPPSGFHYSILGKYDNEHKLEGGPGSSKYDTRPIQVIFDQGPAWTLGKKFEETSIS